MSQSTYLLFDWSTWPGWVWAWLRGKYKSGGHTWTSTLTFLSIEAAGKLMQYPSIKSEKLYDFAVSMFPCKQAHKPKKDHTFRNPIFKTLKISRISMTLIVGRILQFFESSIDQANLTVGWEPIYQGLLFRHPENCKISFPSVISKRLLSQFGRTRRPIWLCATKNPIQLSSEIALN